MEYTQAISRSRINIVSVISGIMLTLASMFLSMSLAAALGFWSYRPDELPLLGPEFWKGSRLLFGRNFLEVIQNNFHSCNS